MPSGETHLKLELILLPGFLVAFYLLNPNLNLESLLLFGGTYLLSSLLLSPDLDLRVNKSRRRWGPLRFIWFPYTKIFKHRGLSHSLLFGPFTRLAYLAVIIALLLFFLSFLGISMPKLSPSYESLIVMAIGLCLPNAIHVLIDRLDYYLLRRFRRR